MILDGASAVFDGVTVDSSLRLHNNTLEVQNGLTLNGTATLVRDGNFDNAVRILFHTGSALLGSGEVVSVGAAEPVGPNRDNQYGNTLKPAADNSEFRIGPGITIHGSLLIGEAANPSHVINEGTIEGSDGYVQIFADQFDNLGVVTIDGQQGILQPLANLTDNKGQFVAQNGGNLQLLNPVRWEPGGRIDNQGGKIQLYAVVDITAAPLNFTGELTLVGGTIRGGIVSSSNGLLIVQSGTLDAVQLDANMQVHNAILDVRNGLTLNGVATLIRDGNFGNVAWILFHSGSALLGSGEVVSIGAAEAVGLNRDNQYGNALKPAADSSEFRIGPGITIHGSLFIGEASNPSQVINEGTIEGSQTVQIWASQFDNYGTIGIAETGILFVIGGQSHNRGLMKAEGNTQLQLHGPSLNEGSIDVESGGVAYIFQPLDFSLGVLASGTWRVGSNSTLRLYGADIVSLNGAVVLDGPNAQLTNGSSDSALAGLATITAGGSLSLLGGEEFTTAGSLQNAGRLALGVGSSFMVSGAYTQTATGTLETSLADGGNSGRITSTNAASVGGVL